MGGVLTVPDQVDPADHLPAFLQDGPGRHLIPIKAGKKGVILTGVPQEASLKVGTIANLTDRISFSGRQPQAINSLSVELNRGCFPSGSSLPAGYLPLQIGDGRSINPAQ